MSVDRDLYSRYLFFKKYAGYVVGKRAIGALQLARAELWAWNDPDITYTWEEDTDFYEDTLGDHAYWCNDARRYDAGYNYDGEKLHRWQQDGPDCNHEILGCSLLCRGDIMASLWGIIDADKCYRRVVEAELALECMPEFMGVHLYDT